MKSLSVVLVVLALAIGACTAASDLTTSQAPAPASTTTSLVIPERVETTTTDDPGAADAATVERLSIAITGLMSEAELLRGLTFVEAPGVVVLEPDVYADRLEAHYAAWLATSSPAGKTAMYQLMGLMRFETAEGILARLEAPPTPVFFDADAFRIVVSGDADELDPVLRVSVIHELILALTDQHHDTSATRAQLIAAGADDRLQAFDALVEGDATYFQLVYLQSLAPAEQVVVAAAFEATETAVVAAIPDYIRSDLAFPYDAGVTFVGELVASAGIVGVDQAYRSPPESSEHILHPERFRRGEAVTTVAPLDVVVDGATSSPSAAFGELQLDHLLSLSMQAGMVTQTVDGWQGDAYQLIETPDGVAFALALVMESDDDAIEVVGGLIAHARDVLEAGDGVEAAGGLLFDGDEHYVFIDRVGDSLIYVLATSRQLGRAVRSQMSVP